MRNDGYLFNPQNDFEIELRDKFLKEFDDSIKEAVRNAPPSRLRMAMLESKVIEQESELHNRGIV